MVALDRQLANSVCWAARYMIAPSSERLEEPFGSQYINYDRPHEVSSHVRWHQKHQHPQRQICEEHVRIGQKIPLRRDGVVVHSSGKRLTQLSGLRPLGTCEVRWGSWVLLLGTIPLMRAAKVVKCQALCP